MSKESSSCQNRQGFEVAVDTVISKKVIRSYGRVKGRKLSDQRQGLLQENLCFYELKASEISEIKGSQKNILEIGFGFGDFLSSQIIRNSDVNFIGAETHVNGVASLFSKLQGKNFLNLKIFKEDVRILLNKIPDQYFDEIFILFPDPWPKQKHYKRRLITSEFLEILSKKIKINGKLIIATDHDSYKTWILSAIFQNNLFELSKIGSTLFVKNELKENFWGKEDWLNFPKDWIVSKYQGKAILEGREPVIFNLTRK